MHSFDKLLDTRILLIEANVTRMTSSFSKKIGVGVENHFSFNEKATNGHFLLQLSFLDGEENINVNNKEEIKDKCQAKIWLNYHIDLPHGVHYEKEDEKMVWMCIYPQIKFDVTMYCNSIGIPSFILPFDLNGR